jgi:type I restriction enzyme S subunit
MIAQVSNENIRLLRFIDFADLNLWDVKRYRAGKIKSDFDIVLLGDYIKEETTKLKPQDFPNQEFKILGVNNKTGIFDAYSQPTSEIKQAYKKMDIGWIAYNPYRVNVGSIGMRTKEHKNDLISPAYVVFSCKSGLNPDFLYKLFKTNKYNQIIKDSTTGSVRQNLTFDLLEKIKIPLPSLNEQEQILNDYYKKINLAKKWEQKAKQLEDYIDDYLFDELGIKIPNKTEKQYGKLFFVEFRDIARWDLLNSNNDVLPSLRNTNYELKELGKAFNFVTRTWDKNNNQNKYFDYIEIGAIDPINGITEIKRILKSKAPSRANQTVKTGDLIIGTTRPYLKKFAIVPSKYNGNVCSSGFSVIEVSNNYNLYYLKEFLMSYFGIEQLKNRMTGGLYPAITDEELRKIKIPIPDITIQNRIANKINRIKSLIKKLQQNSERYKNKAIEDFEKAVIKE